MSHPLGHWLSESSLKKDSRWSFQSCEIIDCKPATSQHFLVFIMNIWFPLQLLSITAKGCFLYWAIYN